MKQMWLTVALAVQVALIALVWGLQWGDTAEPETFLDFDAAAVDAITVAGDDGAIALARVEDAWQLESGLPADADKIDRVLEKLAGAAGGWPVATTDSVMARFEVTEDAHQRHVTVSAGEDTLADIYLGTSPGYQKTHARHVSGGDAYAIDFSNYEAGLEPSDWLKKSLLQTAGELKSLTRHGDGGWTLTATDDGWTAPDATLDQAEVATLVARFEGLTVLDFATVELPEAPYLRFVAEDEDGEQELAFYRLTEDGDHFVVSSRFDGRFEVATYIVENLDQSLADLTAAAETTEDAVPDAGDEAADAPAPATNAGDSAEASAPADAA